MLFRRRKRPSAASVGTAVGRLSGRVCIITGGASGIGRGIVQMFAEEGAAVVLTDIDGERSAAAARALVAEGFVAEALAHDAGDEAAWQKVIDHTLRTHGRLDVLVNNAASGWSATLDETDLADLRKINRVTLEGVFIGMKLALSAMGDTGCIINVASIAGLKGSVSAPAYGAAKAAVVSLTRSAALDCAKKGRQVRVNAIAPGLIQTAALDGVIRKAAGVGGLAAPLVKGQLAKAVPLGFVGEPSDIAHAAVYLASDGARYVTGQVLVVDGGFMA